MRKEGKGRMEMDTEAHVVHHHHGKNRLLANCHHFQIDRYRELKHDDEERAEKLSSFRTFKLWL